MAMEESGLPYKLHLIDLRAKQQFSAEFMKDQPRPQIPALVDPDGPGGKPLTIAESGAILKYVSEKSANGLYPTDAVAQIACDHWMFYGSSTYTTLAQQFGHWVIRSPDDNPVPRSFTPTIISTCSVFLTAIWPIMNISPAHIPSPIFHVPRYPFTRRQRHRLGDFKNVQRWHDAILGKACGTKSLGPARIGCSLRCISE